MYNKINFKLALHWLLSIHCGLSTDSKKASLSTVHSMANSSLFSKSGMGSVRGLITFGQPKIDTLSTKYESEK